MIKEHIFPWVKIHDDKMNDLVLLFTISKVLFRNDTYEDLYCENVYFLPVRSKYAKENPFLEIQESVLKFCQGQNASDIFIFRDLNSWTGDVPDFVKFIEHLRSMHGLQELYKENSSMLNHLEICSIPLERNTADKKY